MEISVFLKKMVLSLVLFLGASFSQADQLLKTFTVKRLFSEGDSIAGFYPNESLPECKWGLMYIDLSKESGKAIFSMLLAAKATGQEIVRIDYAISSEETCLISGLHVV